MAVVLYSPHPCLLSSQHYRTPLLRNPQKDLHFCSRAKLRVILSLHSSNRRRVPLPPIKSASINGYSVHDGSVQGRRESEVEEGNESPRWWTAFVRSILPGGSWWRLEDDVEVRILAEPVTVTRALLKMWELVRKDRWVIFAAFATLIVAAVSFKLTLFLFFGFP